MVPRQTGKIRNASGSGAADRPNALRPCLARLTPTPHYNRLLLQNTTSHTCILLLYLAEASFYPLIFAMLGSGIPLACAALGMHPRAYAAQGHCFFPLVYATLGSFPLACAALQILGGLPF